MNTSDDFLSISSLVNELGKYANGLESGELSTDEVEGMADLSRDLYERLTVIRHKIYEQMLADQRAIEKSEEVDNASGVAEPDSTEERPEIPVGTATIAPNQISLIDSIEEIKRMETSLNDQFKEQGEKQTIKESLQKKPVDDLANAIGINQRFRMINSLFEDDQTAFDDALTKLNSFTSFIEADEYFVNSLKEYYGWSLKDQLVQELRQLVERRYI